MGCNLTYTPNPETAELLNWMLHKIQSVPYSVTLRWTFYQAVQERGLLKSDYDSVKKYCAKARKNFWNGWSPMTLVDDTRTIHKAGGGYVDFRDWINSFKDREPLYEVYPHQERIIQIWFEAQAMFSQFDHYASPYRIPLVPFKGDTSINHKWKIAEYLAQLYKQYRKPIVVLYFGDYEPFKDKGSRAKGLTIPLDALDDISEWLAIFLVHYGLLTTDEIKQGKMKEFLKFVRVGLNQEHINNWHLPENPERPGEYQWEALGDAQARELIDGAIKPYWDVDVIKEIEDKEKAGGQIWREIIEDAIKRFDERGDDNGNVRSYKKGRMD